MDRLDVTVSPDPRGRLAYLAPVDGLRAIAVMAVIAFHAQGLHLDGGFLGVEVFFVVSGYLITSLLMAEHRRTDRVSLRGFWMRRVRRLLPALCALWVGVVTVSATLAPDAFTTTKGDLPGAIFFVSNWSQIVRHHSYFMAVDRPPLLLHLWSLSIEEQFYVVWPMAFAWLAGRVRAPWLAAGAIALAVASAAWMAFLYDPSRDLSDVYYRTDTRLTGLLCGMALAMIPRLRASSPLGRWRSMVLDAAGWSSLLVLVWAFVRLNDSAPLLYRGGFLIVDVATAALIAIAVAPSLAVGRALGAAPLAWIGRRSYGLYLWHWPVFALTRPDLDIGLHGAPLLALRLALTLLLSELCYRFVEGPLRKTDLGSVLRALASGASPAQRARALRMVCAAGVVAAFMVGLMRGGPVRAAGGERLGAPEGMVLADSVPVAEVPQASAIATSAVSEPASPPAGRGIPIDPAWPKTLTLLTDSVTLGVRSALPAALADWKVEVVGRPALMVKQAVPEFLRGRSVGSVVVVGLAYNSLFEKNRRSYDRWAAMWDREAETLLSDLGARGAKKIVWVTLREPSAEVVTPQGRTQYALYAWFFPYVNERLRALAARHPEIALADWCAVSNVPGVTYDLIHLNNAGVRLMTSTIAATVLGP